MSMKALKEYNSPELDIVLILGKDGVMLGEGEGSTDDQFSRTIDHHDDDDSGLSRRQRNVWDEED